MAKNERERAKQIELHAKKKDDRIKKQQKKNAEAFEYKLEKKEEKVKARQEYIEQHNERLEEETR